MANAYMEIMKESIACKYILMVFKTKNFSVGRLSVKEDKKKAIPFGDNSGQTKSRKCWCTKWMDRRADKFPIPVDLYIPLGPKQDLSALLNELDDKLFLGVLAYNHVEVFWGPRLMVVPGLTIDAN